MNSRCSLSLLAVVMMLASAPVLAQTRDGTPGNPPSTATGRAVDRAQGEAPRPDGTPGNPPGTAAGRAADRVLGTDTSGAGPQRSGTVATSAAAAADESTLREGRRASKVIGSNVYNENNETVGEVDDLILPRGGGQPVAVISVGGFLGIGAKRVAVPYDRLQFSAERERWVMPGATKDSLTQLPAFAFDDDRRRGGAGGGPTTPAPAPSPVPPPAR